MKTLKVYMKSKTSEALGPYKRYILWVQGCERHCRGCIAKDSWNLNGGTTEDIDDIVNDILSVPEIEGITISGGEPFLQADALCELIREVKTKRDLGVIVYTGFFYDEIKDNPLTKLCDLIIDGEYVDELNDNLSLRGSSNQNIIPITDRYTKVIEKYYGTQGRKTEMYFDNSGIKLIGIPTKENLKLYQGDK